MEKIVNNAILQTLHNVLLASEAVIYQLLNAYHVVHLALHVMVQPTAVLNVNLDKFSKAKIVQTVQVTAMSATLI